MSTGISDTAAPAPAEVDARAPRFTASVTATVLAAVLILSMVNLRAATVLLAIQAGIFAIGAIFGPQRHPYGVIFRRFLAPRLGSPTDRDPVGQLRFAQMMGAIFSTVGVAGFALGVPWVGTAATGFAFVAALVRALFGVCLSRRPYLLVSKLRGNVPPCCQAKTAGD